jgi:hypothetical protein
VPAPHRSPATWAATRPSSGPRSPVPSQARGCGGPRMPGTWAQACPNKVAPTDGAELAHRWVEELYGWVTATRTGRQQRWRDGSRDGPPLGWARSTVRPQWRP